MGLLWDKNQPFAEVSDSHICCTLVENCFLIPFAWTLLCWPRSPKLNQKCSNEDLPLWILAHSDFPFLNTATKFLMLWHHGPEGKSHLGAPSPKYNAQSISSLIFWSNSYPFQWNLVTRAKCLSLFESDIPLPQWNFVGILAKLLMAALHPPQRGVVYMINPESSAHPV